MKRADYIHTYENQALAVRATLRKADTMSTGRKEGRKVRSLVGGELALVDTLFIEWVVCTGQVSSTEGVTV